MRLFKSLGLAVAVLTLLSGAMPASAQINYSSGSTIAGYTVLPVQDYDRSNDEIIQLNNLTIQSISGNTVYATRSDGTSCMAYSGQFPSAICPPIAPSVLYQISVAQDTILLQKNRARTSLGIFATGDRINVYGFLDTNSQYMQALIMRDLDKPFPQYSSNYVQFNNIRTISAPTYPVPQVAGGITSTFDVVFSPSPCSLYSGPVGYKLSSTCPYVPAGPTGIFMLAKHTVNILSGHTVVMNADRATIDITSIKAGDSLNIFGRYDPQTGNIDAYIIRDLSLGYNISNVSTVSVTVVDQNIRCITAPCGLVPNATVQAVAPNGAVITRVTSNTGLAIFDNLPQAGTYTFQVLGSGNVQSVNVPVGSAPLSITLYTNGTVSQSSIQVTSPNGGETLTRGQQYQIRWAKPAFQGTQFSSGSMFNVYAVQKNFYGGDAVANMQYTLATDVFTDFGMANGSYQWTVGQNREGMQMPDGRNYFIRICYSSGSIPTQVAPNLVCDESDAPFTITSGIAQTSPQIYSLSPASAPVGTQVTISGSGFSPTGNIVHFSGTSGSAYLPNISSSNGSSVTFTVPSYTSIACEYSTPRCLPADYQLLPGTYSVWVENANGAVSNQAPFIMQSGSAVQNLQLWSMTPQSGTVGTYVTISGTGFTSTDNRVIIGSYQGASVTSNGTSISFTIPSYMGANCQPYQACPMYAVQTQPGLYAVHVENSNGSSNSLNLQIY